MSFPAEGSICLYLWLFVAAYAVQIGSAEPVPFPEILPDVTNVIPTQDVQLRKASSACMVPPQPENGQWQLFRSFCDRDLDCDIPQGIEVRNGSHLVYNCNPGYSIEGSSDVYCTNRGRWSAIPSCVPDTMTQCSSPRCLVWGQSVPRRDDYTYTPGIGAHKLHTRALVWNDARITCQDEGGHLAIVNSVAEANTLADLFANSEPIVGSPHPNYACIGFQDLFFEGDYTTLYDQSVAKAGFDLWLEGQPNNRGGDQNCGSIHISGRLNDIECDLKCGFICELPVY